MSSVSLVADSIYDQVVPEIYTDSDMPVNCKIATGRDESDFYEALGIVGEGPLGAYTPPHMEDKDGDGKAETFVGHALDGQAHRGWPNNDFGLRTCLGGGRLEARLSAAGDGWSKDGDANTAFGDSVERLPFHGMSRYPYPPAEHYPDDAAHRDWRARYNTRLGATLLPRLARRTSPPSRSPRLPEP